MIQKATLCCLMKINNAPITQGVEVIKKFHGTKSGQLSNISIKDDLSLPSVQKIQGF